MYPTVEYVVYVIEQSAGTSAILIWPPLVSIGIAAAALYFSIKHIKDERNHKILTTKPRLIFELSNPTQRDPTLTLSITNCGLGPAIIKNISASIRDQHELSNPIVDLGHYLTNKLHVNASVNTPAKEQHIAPNRNYTLITISGDFGTVMSIKGKLSRNCDISVKYESIYGEEFTEAP